MTLRKLRKPSPEDVKPKDVPDDYTGSNASNRVLKIDLYFIKYGTDDKFQGAAIFFTLLIFVLIAVVYIVGCFCPEKQSWSERYLPWLQYMFTATMCIAIGRSTLKKADE